MKATCADCGSRCQRSKAELGWEPPSEPLCRDCRFKRRRASSQYASSAGSAAPKRGKAEARAPRRSGGLLTSGRWKKLRAQVIGEEPLCRLMLTGCTGKSDTADHILPVAYRPDLKYMRANLQGACQSCNMLRTDLSVICAMRRFGTLEGADDEATVTARELNLIAEALTWKDVPPPPKVGRKRKPKSLRIYRRCHRCNSAWILAGGTSKHCPDCTRELNAISNRNRYRTKVGLPTDPRPPKRYAA